MKTLLNFAVSAALFASSATAFAADAVLITMPDGLSVTTADVTADAQRIPPDVRAQILSEPRDVAQLAHNVLVRRLLAGEAEKAQLDRDPLVAVQLRLARERVLAEARIAQIEGPPADRATLEKLAQAEYRAKPQAHDLPEEIRVSHILIDSRSCDADKRIAQLLEQARAPGADFAALARDHSQDPGSAKRGGDLGFFARGRMNQDFENAAFALKNPGDLSGIVRSEFGLHIIRLEERKLPRRQPFDKVREAMINDLAARELRIRRATITDAISKDLQMDRAAIEAFAKQPH